MGYRPDNPAGDALGQALGRQQAVVQHMQALPHGAVADALATVRASSARPVVKLIFEFVVLTAARSGEVRLHPPTAVLQAHQRRLGRGSRRGPQDLRRHRFRRLPGAAPLHPAERVPLARCP